MKQEHLPHFESKYEVHLHIKETFSSHSNWDHVKLDLNARPMHNVHEMD